MKSGKKTGKAASRLFSMLLAVALFITMMPFGAVSAFAEDSSETPIAALRVIGDGLVNPLTFDSIKTLKNDEAIKALTREGVKFNTINSEGTVASYTVTGVRIEDLIKLAGIKEGYELESVSATADDETKSKVYTADEILNEDILGNKAMFIWLENDDKVQKTAIGQFEENENNRGKWWKAVTGITLTVTVKKSGSDPEPTPEPTPEPAPAVPVLDIVGNGLAKSLTFESIKELKNDEAIKALTREDVKFKTLNAYGTEGESTVTGVRIEDLIKLAGIKKGYVVKSVTAKADDGYTVTYSADEVLKKDLQGNKAMFVWLYDGEKVQMTAVGQHKEGEANKAKWNAGDALTLTINTQKVTKPGKPKVTLTAGKKKATVKWKKISGAVGYEIWRSTKKTKGFKRVKTITKGSTVKFINKSLKGKKAYYYKVRAYKKDANGNKIYGSYSSVKKVTTKK